MEKHMNNLKIAAQFYDFVRAGDIASATACFAEDITWIESPFPGNHGGTFIGRKTVVDQVLAKFVGTWVDLTVTPERFIDGGPDVVVLGTYRGKHRETTRPFEARFAHTWTFVDGRVVRVEQLADTVKFFETVSPGISG